MCFGNTGPLLLDVSSELVSVSGLIRHFRLCAPIIVTRWVKAGLPHAVIAKRRVFRIPEVEAWLQAKGYSLTKLTEGAGLVAAHRRKGARRWRKGQMSGKGAEGGSR